MGSEETQNIRLLANMTKKEKYNEESEKLAALLLVLAFSMSLTTSVFAQNSETHENGYHVGVYLDTPNTAYYSNYTTSGMPQAAYVGTNFTFGETSTVLFTVNCKAGTTTWRGARNTLPGYGYELPIQVSGYTVNKGLSNTLYQVVLDHTGGSLEFARGKVQKPSAKGVQSTTPVWTQVTMEESAFAVENRYK